ncbi:MAG: hypothetical protein U0031_20635 [Thermomicrobiales bacterium]
MAVSVSVLVQVVPQQSGVLPEAAQNSLPQVMPHFPPWQVWVLEQVVPQVPQLFVSVLVLVQVALQQVWVVRQEQVSNPPQPLGMLPHTPAGQVVFAVQQTDCPSRSTSTQTSPLAQQSPWQQTWPGPVQFGPGWLIAELT